MHLLKAQKSHLEQVGALQHNIQIIIITIIKEIKIQIDKNEKKQLPQVDRRRWQKVT